jgi:small GTP-binding protein
MIFKWKIAVLGDSSVGKTSLVRHYCEGAFREDYISTIGVSFLRKEISLENHQITLQIWDLGGQNIFSSVRNNYLKGTHGSLILFDLTEKST